MNTAGIRQSRKKRDPLERWYTSPDDAEEHLAILSALYGTDFLHLHDPCAGGGAYLDAAAWAGLQSATGCDIAPERDDVLQGDFLDGIMAPDPAWVVTNPPFSLAPKLVAACEDRHCSLLLPVSALEAAKKRRPILLDRPPSSIVFVGRKRFGGPALRLAEEQGSKGSGAAMAYAVVTWDPAHHPRWTSATGSGVVLPLISTYYASALLDGAA